MDLMASNVVPYSMAELTIIYTSRLVGRRDLSNCPGMAYVPSRMKVNVSSNSSAAGATAHEILRDSIGERGGAFQRAIEDWRSMYWEGSSEVDRCP